MTNKKQAKITKLFQRGKLSPKPKKNIGNLRITYPQLSSLFSFIELIVPLIIFDTYWYC